MPCNIKNLTMRPVLLTLTSGKTLRLDPQETSSVLGDTEVTNNPKLQKLMDRHTIAICRAESKPEASLVSQLKKNAGNSASLPLEKKEAKSKS